MALYLDGRVQRVLVEFLELGSDVQKIDLGPTHHDSVQSRLVGPATLMMI